MAARKTCCTTRCAAFYLEVENNALDGAVDRLADAIAAPLLDKRYADRERNAVNAELTMALAVRQAFGHPVAHGGDQ